ncbi:MAG: DNA repair protein RecN [Bacteroidales bacterium]|nr:DNA repair protein RecN [Candidatus Cacconaster merdequi]
MLKKLSIGNYVLIDHLEIPFPGDLVIITGETGAGKSILLGALSLILGAKADVSVIKDQTRNCVVEALFETGEGEVIVRRVVSPSGRSRAFVDDEPVTLDELRELSSSLVDIHSQHQHLLLSDRHFQLASLDGYAALSSVLTEYSSLYKDYVAQKEHLSKLRDEIARDEKDREYLEYCYRRLEEAHIVDGELQDLEEEQSRLANVEQIHAAVSRIEGIFSGETLSMDSGLKETASLLSKTSQYLPDFSQLAERVESARIELKDILSEIESQGEGVSFSPERLEEVDARLTLLYDLMRRNSVGTLSELVALRDSLASRLGAGADRQAELDTLQRKVEELEKECRRSAEKIHGLRVAAAPQLSSLIEKKIRSLEMPSACFRAEVVSREGFGPDGADDVRFLFNANGGELQDLSKCASGGELSRIMLCLKSVMANYSGMPTMIFDEIDTGVSGRVADKMGELISEMGRSMQIFAITHLPQVAGKGSAHYLVYKETGEDGIARSNIRQITGEERVMEIARMLSGSTLTAEAVANARVLLNDQ